MKWVRFAHSRLNGAFRCISMQSGAFGFVSHDRAIDAIPGTASVAEAPCATPRGIAQRSPGILRTRKLGSFCASRTTTTASTVRTRFFFSFGCQRAARTRNTGAPSHTPQPCAILITIAHDNADARSKTPEDLRDSRNSLCALSLTSAQKDLRRPTYRARHVNRCRISSSTSSADATVSAIAPRRWSRKRRRSR